MIELKDSGVIFNQENHTYHLGDKQLYGITPLLSEKLFTNKYTNVNEEVLKRAADYGTFVHQQCELIDSLGIDAETEEAINYISLRDENGLVHEASEYIVTDKKHYASAIDKVYRESDDSFILADVKTTYEPDKEYLRWQLSIYAYLFEKQNKGAKVTKLYCIWLRHEKYELIPIERISDANVKQLLDSGVSGEEYVTLPEQYRQIEKDISEVILQCKYWESQKKDVQKKIFDAMSECGMHKWTGSSISCSLRDGVIKKKFDEKRFKEEHPDLYEQYLIDGFTAGSVTIKAITD